MSTTARTRTLYHFTSTYHLPLIERDGVILRTDSVVNPSGRDPATDVVWLLDGPELGELSHGLASVMDKTAVRFTVTVAAVPWLEWGPARRMDRRWKEAIIKGAGGMEAARRWWISTLPIRRPAWTAVDVLDGQGVRP